MEYSEDVINYKGLIDKNVVDNILHELKTKLKILDLEILTRKRIYSSAVECLDNIYRHSELKNNQDKIHETYPPYFTVKKADEGYAIETGNLISNHEMKGLKKKLDELNELESSGVNDLYKKTIMKSAGLTDKGGAGLGLIVIAKTTPRRLFYNFQPVNKYYSYFTLKVKIL
jgi:hypothetical protein